MDLQYASGSLLVRANKNPYTFRCGNASKIRCCPWDRRITAALQFQVWHCEEQHSIFPTATLLSAMLCPTVKQKGKGSVPFGMFKRNQSTKNERKLRLSARANSVIGALVSGFGAGGLSLVTGGYHWRALVPLAFTIVLLLIAVLFGSRAGILGTVLAATIFAAFLFQPLGNLSVMDSSARSNLAWMLLIGVSFSFLFAPPTSGLHRQ